MLVVHQNHVDARIHMSIPTYRHTHIIKTKINLFLKKIISWAVVVHAFIPGTQEVETGESL